MSPDHDRWYWNPESIVRVQEFFGPGWETPFRAVTLLADSSVVLLLAAAVFWIRGRRYAYTALAATMTGALIIMAIKLGVEVPRPEHADMIVFESRIAPSFPSGHAMHAIAFWGTLAVLGLIRFPVVAGIAVAVIISRVYLGIHYPADMFAGALIGLLGVLAGYVLWTWIMPRLTDLQLSTLLGCGMLGAVAIIPVANRLPNGWEIVGGLLGAGVGSLLESRKIGYRPIVRTASATALRAGIGVAGALVCGLLILVARQTGGPGWLMAIAVFPLGVWATGLAPLVFDRLGLNDAQPPAFQSAARSLFSLEYRK
jgi:membrane-associated phospholipid phosphatase